MSIGFSKLERIVYEREFKEWKVTLNCRRLRAIAVYEGKDPQSLSEQDFLINYSKKGTKSI